MRRVPRRVRPFAAAVLAGGALLVSRNARAQEAPAASATAPEDVPVAAPQPAPPAPSGPGKAVTVRASGGVAFVSSGYYCGYYGTYYLFSGGCGAGYAVAQPELNLDVDVWLRPGLGLSLGASVLWGSYAPGVTGVPPTRIYSTSWEPHLDVLLGLFPSAVAMGRLRLGVGLSVAKLHGLNTTAQDIHYTGVGGAARLGLGVSFFPKSTVGIGMDAVLEFGGMGGHYVSTIQLLLGPELHF
jgi:hypothetical protein